MIVGSIKEDLASEKRVSLTPETAKNIIGLGLKVCVEKEYAIHLGIKDNEYEKRYILRSSLRPINSSFGHCAANPGNDKKFEKELDKNIKELLN